ncbi:MAG: helix-hairpin-helix domain-containing protein [Bacteroidota bacterium]
MYLRSMDRCFFFRMLPLSLFFYLSLQMTPMLYAQQRDTLPPEEETINIDLVEDFIQGVEDDVNFDFNALFDNLSIYRENPLDLNKVSREDLEDLRLLSTLQINNFLSYRREAGKLIAIYELQAIPGFDLSTINQILPFVQVGGDIDDYQLPIGQMLLNGDNELFIRWSRTLEEQRGFVGTESNGFVPSFEGDPNQIYLRYRHNYEDKLSYGITAEKDPGEAFFAKSNPRGFDFYSAHFFLKNYSKRLKSLAIGDFTASMGQGLIMYTGFGRGKSSEVMDIRRSRLPLNAYRSVNENDFLRGVGATIGLSERWELTAFGSFQKRDANLILSDTLENDENIAGFTSLQNTGLHRTANEIADEDAINHLAIGGTLKYKTDLGHIAVNGLFNRFNQALNRVIFPYNRFFFNGDQLINASVDYAYVFRNYNFFGETAISDNGKVATINGLILGLDRELSLALLHRHFPAAYQAINANAFAETTGTRNESGFYIGLEMLKGQHWKFAAYADLYRHPWLRFGVDAPSNGVEYRARVTYKRKRRMQAYIEFRHERRQRNAVGNTTKLDFLVETIRQQWRFNVSNKLTSALELRARLDVGYYDSGSDLDRETGVALYQDILYKPKRFPVSFTARFSIYETDGYNIRFYSFENDLLYTFSIPSYYNKGSRFYFNVRYKGIRNLTLEARYAQTYWPEAEGFGNSFEEILGQRRSQVRVQMKYKF